MAEFDPEARMIAGPQFDKIYCPSCNSPNPVGSKFCVHCSSYLDELEDDARSADGDGEDALDSLLARQREETTEPEQVTPTPPDPGADLPAPISSPGPSVAATPAAPPSSAPAPSAPVGSPDSGDPDVLPQPVHLADGRVITRRSTLAKLEKLQQILGEAGPLTGATKGKSDEVLALEAKVMELTKEMEKLTVEKEEIVQAYMADALSDEGPEAADAQAAIDEANARASRAEADAARLERAESDMHKEMRSLMARVQEVEAESEALKARLLEQPDDPFAGAGGADPAALEAAEQRARELEASLQQVTAQGQELSLQLHQKEAELAAAHQQVSAAQEGSQQLLEGQLNDQAAALAEARTKLAEREQEAQALRSRLEAAQASGGGGDVEILREQLSQVQAAAKDQVRVVTRYYERILGRVPCGVMVLAEGGIILSVNPAVTSLLGLPAAELLRKTLDQVPALHPLQEIVASLDAHPDQDLAAQPVELACVVGPITVETSAARGELGSRTVKILVLDPATGEGDGGGGGGGAPDPQGIREDLFGLRMMIELLGSKSDKPQVVSEVTRDLLGDLDRILSDLQ